MAQALKKQSEIPVTCPYCEAPLMTHSKRTRFEKERGYDIEQLKCERCGFEMPNLIDKDSK